MIKKILKFLDTKHRQSLFYLQIYFIILSLVEVFGVLSIAPLIYVISANSLPEIYLNYPYVKNYLLFDSLKEFQIFFSFCFLFLIIFYNFTNLFCFYKFEKLLSKIHSDKFYEIFKYNLNMDYQKMLSVNSSDITNNLTYNLQLVIEKIYRLLFKANTKLYSLIFITIAICYFDIKNALILFSILAITFFFGFYFIKKKIYFLGANASRSNKKLINIIKETFQNFKFVSLISDKSFLKDIVKNNVISFTNSNKKIEIFTFFSRILIESLGFFIIISLILILLFENSLQIFFSVMSFYLFAFYRLFPALQQLFYSASQIKSWGYLLDNLLIINKPHKTTKLVLEKINFNNHITFKNITFQYEKKNNLENLNFRINKNDLILLSGSTGSGKTTILDLLTGILTPHSGEILIDDIRLTNENKINWMKNIGYVTQNVFFIEGSIRDNIIFGRKKYDEAYLNKVTEIALVNRFLNKKNLDLSALVEENGANFSGGQLQSIAIGRSILTNPSLLILDEATNAMDEDLEKDLITSLKLNLKETTIVMVSHNKKLKNLCDKIIEI